MNLFSLVGVRQVFAGRTVLDIDRLDLLSGHNYALQGPNGSGKTTLLQVLAFLEEPTQGKVYFNGEPVVWREKKLCALRRKVILVDQHPIMFSTSVRNNVEYGLRMRGLAARQRRRLAEESLELVGLKDFVDRPAHRLSGGETQRVAIARALACAPQVLLFDEPTASVDVENQALIERVIQEIHRQKGVSVIFATHKRLEAARLADHRIFLFNGKLSGPGGENMVSGTLVSRNGSTFFEICPGLDIPVVGGTLGSARASLKPEGIHILSGQDQDRQPVDRSCPATVQQMTVEGNSVKVLLDVGVPLKTIVPHERVAADRILVGDRVQVVIDPQTVQIVA